MSRNFHVNSTLRLHTASMPSTRERRPEPPSVSPPELAKPHRPRPRGSHELATQALRPQANGIDASTAAFATLGSRKQPDNRTTNPYILVLLKIQGRGA